MSTEARALLCSKLIFKDEHDGTVTPTQRRDLMTELQDGGTDTALIALGLDLISAGFFLEVTAVRTDHHNDGPDGHYGGRAFDGWFLNTPVHADWTSGVSPHFADGLEEAALSPWSRQLAVTGEADTLANRNACGAKLVPDSGADHVHFGSTVTA